MRTRHKVLIASVLCIIFVNMLSSQTAVYNRMQKVAVGEYQIHYIHEDSTLWAAGSLASQYLATGGEVNPGMPIPTRQANGLPMPKFIKAFGGLHQNAAIDQYNRVWTLGEPSTSGCEHCIAGDGGGGDYTYATLISTDDQGNPFTGITMLSMFAGYGSLGWYAIKGVDSTLWWWGMDNSEGYSLDGSGDVIVQNKPRQVPLPANKKAIQVVSGGFAIVLFGDGTVYTGAGGCDPYQVPKGYPCTGDMFLTLNKVPGISHATSVAGGHQIGYAVCGLDSVKAWGRPNLLGIGRTDIGPQITPILLDLDVPSPVQMIVTNTTSSHAILADSTLWGWGHSAQGEVGNGTMLDKNIYNFYGGIDGDTIITTPQHIVTSRKDFVNIYGTMPYTFFSYFEAANGQMYFCGRNKAGVGGNGEIAPYGNNMAADYAQTWSQPSVIPVDIFSLRSSILVPAAQCVVNPDAPGCNGYEEPPFFPPSILASSDDTIHSKAITLQVAAQPYPGRRIASYIWEQLNGPSYAYFNTFNDSIVDVSRLQTGTYAFRVKVTDSLNSFSLDTIVIVVDLTSNGITKDVFSRKEVLLYPNPAHDMLLLNTHLTFKKYQIVSLTGQILTERPFISGIDISMLHSGIFLLKLIDEGGNSRQLKFIKK